MMFCMRCNFHRFPIAWHMHWQKDDNNNGKRAINGKHRMREANFFLAISFGNTPILRSNSGNTLIIFILTSSFPAHSIGLNHKFPLQELSWHFYRTLKIPWVNCITFYQHRIDDHPILIANTVIETSGHHLNTTDCALINKQEKHIMG